LVLFNKIFNLMEERLESGKFEGKIKSENIKKEERNEER
jgi:hypothetical protein